MYAITETGFRTISNASDLMPGESAVDQLPQSLIQYLAMVEGRNMRNALLRQADWTVLPDTQLENREAWVLYRQALRDLPQRPGFPDVEWPRPPSLQAGAGTETGELS